MAKAEERIDKWMWATRIFKTRTIAAEACKKGRISIGDAQAKPSRTVRVGDIVKVRKPPVTYSFLVKARAGLSGKQNSSKRTRPVGSY